MLDAAWSNFSETCAIIDFNHEIKIFDNKGSEINFTNNINKNITSIAWSFCSDTLAFGSSDGNLYLLDFQTQHINKKQINSSITKIFWNKAQELIGIITKENEISVLKSNFTLIFSHTLEFQIENSIFINDCDIFVNNKDGELFYIKKDSIAFLTTLLTPIHEIVLCHNKKNILTISNDNILTIFSLQNDTFKKENQMKLRNGLFSKIAEINNDHFCFSIDDTISIMNYNHEKPINLVIRQNDPIVSFHYFKFCHKLAAISCKGKLCIWKINKNNFSVQLIRKFDSKLENVKTIWSSVSLSLLTITKDNFYTFTKIPKIRFISSDHFNVVQSDAKTLIINSSKRFYTNYAIEKMKYSMNHLLIASKSSCKIFNHSCQCENEFSVKSNIIEIFGTRIFVIFNKTMEIRDINGTIKNSIDLDIKGIVLKSALNGKYLALISSEFDIKIFDISKLTPLIVSEGNVSNYVKSSIISSIGVSRGGFCVSISTKSPNKKNRPILYSPQVSTAFELNYVGKLMWDCESSNFFAIQTESEIISFLINNDLSYIRVKNLPISPDRVLLKVCSPRFIHSALNVTNSSVCSQLFPFLSLLEEVQPNSKRLFILLLLYLKSNEDEKAMKLIENITEKEILNDFLQENNKLNLLETKDKQIQRNSKQTFSERMHYAFINGNLSTMYSDFTEQSPEIRKWYGRYAEVSDFKSAALSHYSLGNHLIETVRVLCRENRFDEAKRYVDNCADKGVKCYFARFLITFINSREIPNTCINSEDFTTSLDWSDNEGIDIQKLSNFTTNFNPFVSKNKLDNGTQKPDENIFHQKRAIENYIINLLCKAERFGMAFEFAVSKNRLDDVTKLSVSAPKNIVCKAARVYEKRGTVSTAIHLYLRSGAISRAVKLIFDTCSYEYLSLFQAQIQQSGNEEVLLKCAQYFENQQNYQNAMNYYGFAKQIEKVQELCEKYPLSISESLVKYLIKTPNEKIGKLLESQQAYLSAAQVYTTLNMKSDAMKMLILLDDIDKVIKFANLIKIPSCYELAADYISKKNPKCKSLHFQTAVDFYYKNESNGKVALLYEKTAKTEIDSAQNYEKALELLQKSNQILAMSDFPDKRKIIERILQKIRWVEMYLEATNAKPELMKALCHSLLLTRNVEDIIRKEDIIFLLIQNMVSNEDYFGAQKLLENLRQNGVDLEFFMEKDSIRRIYYAAGCQELLDFSDDFSLIGDNITESETDTY
ncbi:hypothetical protein TRFO_08943 [Tritrichomonas foetus]|uniref:Anaphase-promoting complex subunit 4 WD40 domain-containing protein n=1 Tax=Tritrichomonas foetus TaxID=1144522 RepID=A0A1J4JGT1_9EUKA|nr:hypothetical protein TRFO_08943 [Tritrichomonas foetus]|eukprot:OHS98354.1 hypothetical protein TRFO_08943 [Tritrichomonas foetus]